MEEIEIAHNEWDKRKLIIEKSTFPLKPFSLSQLGELKTTQQEAFRRIHSQQRRGNDKYR